MAGTLLVGVLLAFSGHTRQLKRLQTKQQAVADLDRFLNSWAAFQFSDTRFEEACERSAVQPFGSRASVGGSLPKQKADVEPTSFIRVTSDNSQDNGDFQLQVVRVEAYGPKKSLISHNPNSSGKSKPLAWVEILRSRRQRDGESG
ncbi:MAG: hypothetical protein AAGG44_19650 [Planctomycetota bacterium]